MKRPDEVLSEAFEYNPETGVLTRIFKSGKRRVVASGYKGSFYPKVGFNGQEYVVHRIIWALVHGGFPDLFIDHINGNKSDNRICNLRLATDSQNKTNVGKRQNNTSGIKGVSWDRANNKWMAHATLNGRGYNLGRYADKNAAAAAYQSFARENHGEFYRETK